MLLLAALEQAAAGLVYMGPLIMAFLALAARITLLAVVADLAVPMAAM